MKRKIGLIHTVAPAVPLFNELRAEILPEVEVINLLDEGLIKDLFARGQYTEGMAKRLGMLASFAVESGAEVVMLTCSSMAPMVDEARKMVKVPFLKVDEAMADEAVELGTSIGVIATAHTTLKPTTELIKSRAALKKRAVSVEALLCSGAFEAINRGDLATHDEIVKPRLIELMDRVDVVVLAQASISRVIAQLSESERKVPILSSPRLGMQRLKDTLYSL